MARSVTTRLDQIEPKMLRKWERAWSTYAERINRAIPEDVLNAAVLAPDDEAAWLDFQTAHGLTALVAWHDREDALPIEPSTPDLTTWPSMLESPPPEPPGAWERMHELREGTGDAAAYAACAILVLGIARTVRTTKGAAA